MVRHDTLPVPAGLPDAAGFGTIPLKKCPGHGRIRQTDTVTENITALKPGLQKALFLFVQEAAEKWPALSKEILERLMMTEYNGGGSMT